MILSPSLVKLALAGILSTSFLAVSQSPASAVAVCPDNRSATDAASVIFGRSGGWTIYNGSGTACSVVATAWPYVDPICKVWNGANYWVYVGRFGKVGTSGTQPGWVKQPSDLNMTTTYCS